MGLRDPEWIGPYRVIQRIGSGGTGATFLALANSSAHASRLLCCVKTPLARWARDPAYLRAFENEAQIASLLDHPNIVRLHDVGADRGQPYLAYPLIEGIDLGELIESVRDHRQQLAWPLVASIALQMARALEHAHADHRGSGRLVKKPAIIHRDICPSNILIGVSGVSYLTDFGLARALEELSIRPSLNGTGRIMYSAPERLMDGRGYDGRADLFSLGVVLYEALTGRPPFPQAPLIEHVERVLRGVPPRVESSRVEFFDGGAPPDELVQLINIVHRLLEPEVEHRFGSAAELVDALATIRLPGGVHRELAAAVEDHMPAWRREVRLCSGAHQPPPEVRATTRWDPPSPDSIATTPRGQVVGDEVRVDELGAERLLARRYTPLVVSRPQLVVGEGAEGQGDDTTDLDRPSFDSTDPDRPVFASTTPEAEPAWASHPAPEAVATAPEAVATATLVHAPASVATAPISMATDFPKTASIPTLKGHEVLYGQLAQAAPWLAPPPPAGERAPAPQVIPPTRSGFADALPRQDEPSGVRVVQAQVPSHSSPTPGPSRSDPPHPFAARHLDLTSYPELPSPGSIQRRKITYGLILVAAVFVTSLVLLGARDTLWVPLLTGQLGWTILDHFWTPLLTRVGLAGVGLSVLGAVGLAIAGLRSLQHGGGG